jgi:hypothetical protein
VSSSLGKKPGFEAFENLDSAPDLRRDKLHSSQIDKDVVDRLCLGLAISILLLHFLRDHSPELFLVDLPYICHGKLTYQLQPFRKLVDRDIPFFSEETTGFDQAWQRRQNFPRWYEPECGSQLLRRLSFQPPG